VFEERHVFEEELLLEVLGSGGDDDALAALDDGEQVGEGFARSGAGLDDEMALLFDGLFDGGGHGELSAAEFVGWMALGENSAGSEVADAEAVEDVDWVGSGTASIIEERFQGFAGFKVSQVKSRSKVKGKNAVGRAS
jgi:hypothetical protein